MKNKKEKEKETVNSKFILPMKFYALYLERTEYHHFGIQNSVHLF